MTIAFFSLMVHHQAVKQNKKGENLMPYWRLHYHAIWTCKNREPLISNDLESELYQYLRGKGMELGAIIHAIGGIENHVHVVFSLAPKYAIATFIGKLKGASSHWITKVLRHPEPFEWQRGYGVLSFGSKNLPQLIHYALNQKEHHQCQTTNEILERCIDEDDGVAVVADEFYGSPYDGRPVINHEAEK